MRRNIALLFLLAAVAMTTWMRSERVLVVPGKVLTFEPLRLPPPSVLKAHLGPFRLEAAWRMTLGSWLFGGYSSLVPLPDGRFLAVSDGGNYLAFTPPGERRRTARYGVFLANAKEDKALVDLEATTRDPRTGTLWLGVEGLNMILRMSPQWIETGRARPRAIAGWGRNTGPEAMIRLADGRFVLLREAPLQWWRARRHDAVIFPGDPVARPDAAKHFTFEGPGSFDPVDMAQLPDGRLLVLMRTLAWPFPQRFAGRIVVGDPKEIRAGRTWRVTEVARLSSSLPVDNFEAIAVTPRRDGLLTVWLMSDDNQAKLQRTLLWKLVVDPARLPR